MSPGSRLAAKSIDWVLLWGVIFLVFVAATTTVVDLGQMSTGDVEALQRQIADSMVVRIAGLVTAVLPGVYFTLTEGLTGQTLGKRAVGLEVRSRGGGRPALADAFRRNVWHFALLVPGGWGAIITVGLAASIGWSIYSGDDDGWHDRLSDTRVVRSR